MVKKEKRCSVCQSTTTLIYKDSEYWYKRPDDPSRLLCRKCYMKIILNPRINSRRMVFKGKRIAFPFTVRQRKCAIMDCVGSDTQRHHIEYVTCFPLAMTVELCIAHHMEENAKQERLQQEYYFDWNRTVIITTS